MNSNIFFKNCKKQQQMNCIFSDFKPTENFLKIIIVVHIFMKFLVGLKSEKSVIYLEGFLIPKTN